jgi:hypothetical protein
VYALMLLVYNPSPRAIHTAEKPRAYFVAPMAGAV